MATRPTWSGFLKLSLVTCPIRLYPATTHANAVAFHFIHPKTHNRIQMKPHDPELGEVERKDLVRGFETKDGKYVTVTDADLAKIRLKSTKTIEIEKFVDFDDIDPLYLDDAYFVVPDGETAAETYAVIREAMRKKKKAALGRLVLAHREHVVAIVPRGSGMILHRLRDAREVRAKAPFDDIKPVKVDSRMVTIAEEIIEQNTGKFAPSELKDPYEEALIDMIKRRAKGAKPIKTPEPETPSNVVDLMDALKKSLGKRRTSSKHAESADEPRVVAFRRRAGARKSKPAPKRRKRAGRR